MGEHYWSDCGALLAGGFTVGSTALQKQADAERSRSDFLQDQRLETYSNYLAGLKKLKDAETVAWVLAAANSGNLTGHTGYRSAYESMITAGNAVDLDLSRFRLICSKPVCSLAEPLAAQHDRIKNDLLKAVDMSSDEMRNSYQKASAAVSEAEQALIQGMQEELGVTQIEP